MRSLSLLILFAIVRADTTSPQDERVKGSRTSALQTSNFRVMDKPHTLSALPEQLPQESSRELDLTDMDILKQELDAHFESMSTNYEHEQHPESVLGQGKGKGKGKEKSKESKSKKGCDDYYEGKGKGGKGADKKKKCKEKRQSKKKQHTSSSKRGKISMPTPSPAPHPPISYTEYPTYPPHHYDYPSDSGDADTHSPAPSAIDSPDSSAPHQQGTKPVFDDTRSPTTDTTPAPTPLDSSTETETEQPTSDAALSIEAEGSDGGFTTWIQAKPVLLRVTGGFDPKSDKEAFFDVVESNIQPYSRALIGSLLDELTLSMNFVLDLTSYETMALNGESSTVVTSYATVDVTYKIVSEDLEGIDDFTKEEGSELVRAFFEGNNKLRLFSRLEEAGLSVSDISLLNTLPSSMFQGPTSVFDDNADAEETDDPESDNEPATDTAADGTPVEETSKRKGGNNTALYAAAISGGVILVLFGLVFCLSYRKRSLIRFHGGKDGHISTSSSDGSSLGRLGIKPAAIQQRREQSDSSSTISSFYAGDQAKSKHLKFLSTTTEDENSLTRIEEGPDLVASGALTCLDGDESISELHNLYPEFDMYQSTTPPRSNSPAAWSVSGISHSTPFSTSTPYNMGEDYLVARQRWHDEANDVAMIALPDHDSELGYASSSVDQTTEEYDDVDM